MLDMQNWSFFANLAYGVTTGRDPQTGTNDMFAYQDLVETGELVGPRAFSTGPGVFSDTDFQSAEEVEGGGRPLQEVLPHEHAEVVHDRQPPPAPVDDRGLPQERSHADHRGGPRPEAEPDARPRRLQRQRAQPAGGSAVRRRGRAVREDRDLVHADAAGRLRRAVRRDRFLHDDGDPRRPQDPPVHPARDPRRQGQALGLVPQGRACLSR